MKFIMIVLAVALFAAAALFAPSPSTFHAAAAVPAPTPSDKPIFTSYKGISIGMNVADVRAKLGTPNQPSDEQDSFVFSEQESAQVYYDPASHTVKALMVMFTGKLDGAPSVAQVFGEDIEANADGGVFKKADYPKAGFWISYNKTGGSEPMIIIAINKM